MRRIVNQQIRPEEGFLGDGGWRGKPMSCFVTGRKAVCKVGDKMAAFYVFDTPHGVYPRPEIKLINDWIKVAHRGDDSQGGVCKSGATRGIFPAQKIRRFGRCFLRGAFNGLDVVVAEGEGKYIKK